MTSCGGVALVSLNGISGHLVDEDLLALGVAFLRCCLFFPQFLCDRSLRSS